MVTDPTNDLARIRRLKHQYCWCFDAADLDGLITLFTADAVCELGPFGTWRGVEDIRAGFAKQMVSSGVPGGVMHVVSNPLIEMDGNQARGRWYLVDYATSPDVVSPVKIVATYDDDYRCERGDWLIARTSLQVRWRSSTANRLDDLDPTRAAGAAGRITADPATPYDHRARQL
jgi:hypothetical protein